MRDMPRGRAEASPRSDGKSRSADPKEERNQSSESVGTKTGESCRHRRESGSCKDRYPDWSPMSPMDGGLIERARQGLVRVCPNTPSAAPVDGGSTPESSIVGGPSRATPDCSSKSRRSRSRTGSDAAPARSRVTAHWQTRKRQRSFRQARARSRERLRRTREQTPRSRSRRQPAASTSASERPRRALPGPAIWVVGSELRTRMIVCSKLSGDASHFMLGPRPIQVKARVHFRGRLLLTVNLGQSSYRFCFCFLACSRMYLRKFFWVGVSPTGRRSSTSRSSHWS